MSSNVPMDPSVHYPLLNTRPLTYSSMPMHMYPLPSSSQRSSFRTKRRQVKNACTNCQRACKKCDDARPCLRCIKYGIPSSECVNSTRKERKKGVKRGPYKKRDCKGRASNNSVDPLDPPAQTAPSPDEDTEASSSYYPPPTAYYPSIPLPPPPPSLYVYTPPPPPPGYPQSEMYQTPSAPVYHHPYPSYSHHQPLMLQAGYAYPYARPDHGG